MMNSLALVSLIPEYLEKITSIGPLFRDLKIKGETYITRQQRQWYEETNPQLPLYQRSQLLQSQILKKIRGLEQAESHKAWVKDEWKNASKLSLKMIRTKKRQKKTNAGYVKKSVNKLFVANSAR